MVEIKLGGKTLIEEGAATLNKLAGLMRTKDMVEPRFRMVLTAKGAFGYYLSSSLPSDDSDPWHQSACDLQFKKTGFAQYDYYRYAGLTVRPVR